MNLITFPASTELSNQNISNILCNNYEECKCSGISPQQLVGTLLNIAESKVKYLREHCEKVGVISYMLALELKLPAWMADLIHIAGQLHDIGFLALPERIVQSFKSLSVQEFDLIKNHPTAGGYYLKDIKFFSGKGGVLEMVIHHHERWDGKGYPSGLKKREIPLGARILGISDSFCTMIHGYPFGEPLSLKEALEELENKAGSNFDPLLVEVFINSKEKIISWLGMI